ncbi:MAG: protein kinase [Planctomycetia bacterium]|nr:protein kinase [Planctomycetia bacterium]
MTCPASQQLRRFLNDELSSDEHSIVVGHVADCLGCQRVLDGLTSDPTPMTNVSTITEPGLQNLMHRLRERPLVSWSVMTELVGSSMSPRFAGPISDVAPLGWLGPYQIEAELGAGGTGQVFAARDSRLERRVAIKVLRPQWAGHAEARTRFEREARAVAALEDERIVKVFEVGLTPDGLPFLVMEFIDGESLETRLRRERAISPREAAAIARQVACGLSEAHRHGIVHRDVKPSNVLLIAQSNTSNNDLPPLKLADFGLARVTNTTEQLTQEGFIAGTPAYMSPEQIRRPQDADARSDIYSTAVLLYEMLTGERPFRGVVRMVLSQALHEEPVPPRRLNDRVPRDLETICLKGMSKEPSRRYETADEFADDLQRWLNGQPVHARPIGSVGRVWRWCCRNPKFATLNAVVIVVLLAGSADVARYARPQANLSRELAVSRAESDRLRREDEQLRYELSQLSQSLIVAVQNADDQATLEELLNRLTAIRKTSRNDFRPAIATIHDRLSESNTKLGKLSSARINQEAAIKLLRELTTEQPQRRDWKIAAVTMSVRFAELTRQLGSELEPESDKLVTDCMRELDSLAKDQSDRAETSEIAFARIRFSETLSRLGKLGDARRELRLGCEAFGRIATQPGCSTSLLRKAIATIGQLANELLEKQEFPEAHELLHGAANWAAQLLDSSDSTLSDQQNAILLLGNLALVEYRLARQSEANQRLDQVEQALLRLEVQSRTVTEAAREVWITSQRRKLSELRSAVSK